MPRLPTLPLQDVTGHQTWSLLKGYLAAALADKGYLRSSLDEQGLFKPGCLTSGHLPVSTAQPAPGTVTGQ